MFPQDVGTPQMGVSTPNTSALVQQNTGLLGTPQFQTAGMGVDPSLLNNTAPQSSTVNPGVASMVKALKGGMQ